MRSHRYKTAALLSQHDVYNKQQETGTDSPTSRTHPRCKVRRDVPQ